MTKLRKILAAMLLTAAPGSAFAQIQPQSLPSQQAQTQSQLNQQSTQSQLGNLQLQQGMAQDRQREQQLFMPPTSGPQATTPQIPTPQPVAPKPPPPPAPKAN
jgi:hypothetical protein